MENWYINNEGQIFGPYSVAQIKEFIQANKLHSGHSLSTNKNDWLPLSDFTQMYVDSQEPATLNIPVLKKRMIGKYEVIGEVGHGGMGTVYHTRDIHLNRECAVKVILGANNENSRKRFLTEANAIAQLNHPNIIRILELGSFNDEYGATHSYFAMDYIDGKSLADAIEEGKGKGLSLTQKLQIFIQICRGVEHAHRKNVIHRDLKPSNIVLTVDNVPIILDFGLARKIDVSTEITKTGEIFGTPQYMAPESIKGQKSTDKKSDVYSLGVILYKIITGRVPFDGDDIMGILFQVNSKLPLAPSHLNTGIKKNSELEIICLKALEKTPEKRINSAKFLGDEIERFLSNKPILTKTPKPWDIVFKKIKHDPFIKWGTFFLIIVMLFCIALGRALVNGWEQQNDLEKQKNKTEKQKNDLEKQKNITDEQIVQTKLSKLDKNMVIINSDITNVKFGNAVTEMKETYYEFENFLLAKENSQKQKEAYIKDSLLKLQKLQMLLKFSVLPNLPEIKRQKADNGPSDINDMVFSANAMAFNKKSSTFVLKQERMRSEADTAFEKIPGTTGIPLVFSPNAKYLVLEKDLKIEFFDMVKNSRLTYTGNIDNKKQINFSPTSRYFAYKELGQLLAIVDLQKDEKLLIPNNIPIGIGMLVFSADEQYLAFFLRQKDNIQNFAILHLKSGVIKSQEIPIAYANKDRETFILADTNKNVFYYNTNFEIREFTIEETAGNFTINEKKFQVMEQKGVHFSTGNIKDKVMGFGAEREIFLIRKIFHDDVENISSYKIKTLARNKVLDFFSARLLVNLEKNGHLYLLDTYSEKFMYHQSDILKISIANEHEALFISEKIQEEEDKTFFYNTLTIEPSLITNLMLSPENYNLYEQIVRVSNKETLLRTIPLITYLQEKLFVILPVISGLGLNIWHQTNDGYLDKLHLSNILIPTKIKNISMGFKQKYIAILFTVSNLTKISPVLIDLEKTNLDEIGNIFDLPEYVFPDNFTANIKNIEFSKTKNTLYFNDQKEVKARNGEKMVEKNTIYSYSLDNHLLHVLTENRYIIEDIKASKKGFVAILYKYLDVEVLEEDSLVVKKFSWERDNQKITEKVDKIAVSPTNKIIALCNEEGQIRIWEQKANGNWENYFNANEIKREEEKLNFGQRINNLSFSPDGRYIAIFSFHDIYIYDLSLKIKVDSYIGYYKGRATSFSEDWFSAMLPSEDARFIVFDQSYFVDEDGYTNKITRKGNELYFKDDKYSNPYWSLRLQQHLKNLTK